MALLIFRFKPPTDISVRSQNCKTGETGALSAQLNGLNVLGPVKIIADVYERNKLA
jgi:hypothetical protein